jgi:hypothetical protein
MTNLSQPASFTAAEQSRLSAFKAAVAAGSYSESICEEKITYLFTRHDLERVVSYHSAVHAGFFTDQLDSHSATTTGD